MGLGNYSTCLAGDGDKEQKKLRDEEMLARRYLVARVGRQFCLVPACMFGGQFFQWWQADDQLALESWTCCLNPRLPYSWVPVIIALVNVAFWLQRRYFGVESPRQVVA
jgi:hypothetical protein